MPLTSRLGPYEILAPLGSGGTGKVFKARDTRLGLEVAVKLVPSRFAADAEQLCTDFGGRALKVNEARPKPEGGGGRSRY